MNKFGILATSSARPALKLIHQKWRLYFSVQFPLLFASCVGSWFLRASTESLYATSRSLRSPFNLPKKNALLCSTSYHQVAFDTLKSALNSALVLSLPDFAVLVQIETDACNNGVSVVLLQNHHPLAFISKPLDPKTQGLSTYEKTNIWSLSLLWSSGVPNYSLLSLSSLPINTAWSTSMSNTYTPAGNKGLH